MLTPIWLNLATRTLRRLESTNQCRAAIIGIGHELNGDDAVGVVISDALSKLNLRKNSQRYDDTRLIITAGPVPENFTGQLRRFKPDLVIFIDSAQMGAIPGSVEWLTWQQTIGMSASTHSLPLSILSQFLVSEIECEVFIIAIQASMNEFGDELSLPVAKAVSEVLQGLEHLLFP
jgi:hydrogenase 3 maturation protease